jgi:hypothetical protein
VTVRVALAALFLVASLTGCATNSRGQLAAPIAAPSANAGLPDAGWIEGSTWRFAVVDAHGAPSGSFDVRVTASKASACLAGDWKKLEVLSQQGALINQPAWTEDGAELRVLLDTRACDSYPMLHGTFGRGRFEGDYFHMSIDSIEELGQATGDRLP